MCARPVVSTQVQNAFFILMTLNKIDPWPVVDLKTTRQCPAEQLGSHFDVRYLVFRLPIVYDGFKDSLHCIWYPSQNTQ